MDGYYSLAFSGRTAFVGLPDPRNHSGSVSVYSENRFGFWVKNYDPFIFIDDAETPSFQFGDHVDINIELACVADHRHVNIFRRKGTQWHQFDRI